MSTDIEKPATGAATAGPKASATGEATSSGPMLVLKPRPTGWRRLGRRLRLRRNRAVVTLVAFLLLWHIVAEFIVAKPIFLATPGATWGAFVDLAQDGTLWTDLRVSGNEFLRGFISGLVVGIALGMFLGTSRRGKDYIDPLINGMYATPLIALAPLFILWFGIGERKTVVLVFLLVVLPIAINTDVGIRATDPQLLDTARSFGATKRQLFTMVRLPTSISFIVAGIRMGIARGLIGVVVGEFFGSQEGVGYRILISSQYFDNPTLLACVLLFSLSGVLLVKIFERNRASHRSLEVPRLRTERSCRPGGRRAPEGGGPGRDRRVRRFWAGSVATWFCGDLLALSGSNSPKNRIAPSQALFCCRRGSLVDLVEHRAAHLGFDEAPDVVDVLHELGPALRLEVPRSWDVDLDDLTDASRVGAHHDDPIGEQDGLVELVGDEDDRLAVPVPDLEQFGLHDLAGLRVECCERLVHQEHRRVDRQGPGQVRPLTHPARELVRIVRFEASELHELDRLADARLLPPLASATHVESEPHVLLDGPPWEQRVLLKDHRHVAAARVGDDATNSDLAGGRRNQPVDGLEQGRLAATARAHHTEELTVMHVEADPIDRGQGVLLPLVDDAEGVDLEQDTAYVVTGRTTVFARWLRLRRVHVSCPSPFIARRVARRIDRTGRSTI